MTNTLQVRLAQTQDHREIANLLFFERHIHRHLDWAHPTEWLGSPFFWVLERNSHIIAVLACPQDQKEVTWVRLFAHAGQISSEEAWEILWEKAKHELAKNGKMTVAAITLQSWVKDLFEKSGFSPNEEIVIMSWEETTPPSWILPKGINIRPMTEADLPSVAIVDKAAFTPIWQNSLSMLKQAYPQAIVATVAESAEGIIGYQFSTQSPYGAHLARLAVHPQGQRKGIASALIGDLIKQLLSKEIFQLSVNTQSDNSRSLALYEKSGFKKTGEEYPVYTFDISEQGETEEIQWDTVKMQ